MNFSSLRYALRGLSAYRTLLDDENESILDYATTVLYTLANGQKEQDEEERAEWGENALSAYAKLFQALCDGGFDGIGDWLWDKLRYTETPFALSAQSDGASPALEQAARRDVDALLALAGLDCGAILTAIAALLPPEQTSMVEAMPRWVSSAPFDFDRLVQFYRDHGAGLYARYRAFLWEDGQLVPVADPDCPKPEDLLGYEQQRSQVETNTRQMMAGHYANNVLLFGDGGTGKSATVKSMLYLPGMEDLRLIEIQKENLTGLPQLMRSLRDKRQKFILFIDDLAFDQDDKTYSSMKTILEGSLEKRPANVVIYATSNRRHLVRQNFSDRGNDEVDASETIAEKTALAERFGLRIPYLSMSKADFLALVDYLAGQAGLTLPAQELHARAMTWEIRHSGRTPRVARQFIASLLG